MFGADTPLVMDALMIAGMAAAAGAAGILFVLRRRKPTLGEQRGPGELEQRVRVLERIATDRSIDLADEIEALRSEDRREGAQA